MTQNGLTVTGTNTNDQNFSSPTSTQNGNASLALTLLGPTTATPEPASLVLLGTGLVGLFGVARRVRRA